MANLEARHEELMKEHAEAISQVGRLLNAVEKLSDQVVVLGRRDRRRGPAPDQEVVDVLDEPIVRVEREETVVPKDPILLREVLQEVAVETLMAAGGSQGWTEEERRNVCGLLPAYVDPWDISMPLIQKEEVDATEVEGWFKDGELGEEYEDGEYEDLEQNDSDGGFGEWLCD